MAAAAAAAPSQRRSKRRMCPSKPPTRPQMDCNGNPRPILAPGSPHPNIPPLELSPSLALSLSRARHSAPSRLISPHHWPPILALHLLVQRQSGAHLSRTGRTRSIPSTRARRLLIAFSWQPCTSLAVGVRTRVLTSKLRVQRDQIEASAKVASTLAACQLDGSSRQGHEPTGPTLLAVGAQHVCTIKWALSTRQRQRHHQAPASCNPKVEILIGELMFCRY